MLNQSESITQKGEKIFREESINIDPFPTQQIKEILSECKYILNSNSLNPTFTSLNDFNKIIDLEKTLQAYLQAALTGKNILQQRIVEKLQRIFSIQSEIKKILKKFTSLKTVLKDLNQYLTAISCPIHLHEAYLEALKEIIRRNRFRSELQSKFDEINSEIYNYCAEEDKSRSNFMKKYGKYIPTTFLPELKLPASPQIQYLNITAPLLPSVLEKSNRLFLDKTMEDLLNESGFHPLSISLLDNNIEQQLQKLNEENRLKETRLSFLESEINCSKLELQSVVQQKVEFEYQITEVTAKNQELLQKLNENQLLISNLETTASQIVSELHQKQEMIEKKDMKISSLEDLVGNKDETISDLEANNKFNLTKIEELQNQIAKLEEIEKLSHSIVEDHSAKIVEYTSQLKERSQELADTLIEKSHLEKEAESLRNELNSLRNSASISAKEAGQMKTLENENLKLATRISFVQEQNDALQQQIVQLQAQLAKSTEKELKCQSNLDASTEEIKKLSRTVQELNNSLEEAQQESKNNVNELSARVKCLTEAEGKLTAKVEESERVRELLEEKVVQLEAQIAISLSEQINLLQSKNQELTKEIHRMAQEKQTASQQVEMLSKKCEESAKVEAALRQQATQMEAQIVQGRSKMEGELQHISEELIKANEQNRKLTEVLTSSEQENKGLHGKLTEIYSQLQRLQGHYQTLESENEQLKEKLREASSRLESVSHTLSLNEERHANEKQYFLGRDNQLNEQLKAACQQNSELREQLKYLGQMQDTNERLAMLIRENEELKKQLQLSGDTIMALRISASQYDQEVEENKKLNDHIKILKKTEAAGRKELDTLEVNFRILEAAKREAEERNNHLLQELDALNRQIAAHDQLNHYSESTTGLGIRDVLSDYLNLKQFIRMVFDAINSISTNNYKEGDFVVFIPGAKVPGELLPNYYIYNSPAHQLISDQVPEEYQAKMYVFFFFPPFFLSFP